MLVLDDIILACLGFAFPMRIVTLFFFFSSLKGRKIHRAAVSAFMPETGAEGKGLNMPPAAEMEFSTR